MIIYFQCIVNVVMAQTTKHRLVVQSLQKPCTINSVTIQTHVSAIWPDLPKSCSSYEKIKTTIATLILPLGF
jgi:hypothetical protein